MIESQAKENRWYPQYPMVGVHALVYKEGRVLLAKRAKEPNKGKWSVPGGRLELGETIFEAAKREVREECSVEIEIEHVLDVADAIMRDDNGSVKYHFVVIYLLAKYTGGEAKAQSDAEDCGWFTPEELKRPDMHPYLHDLLKRANIL
jgi:ADP-ribose pyrophosphatase